MNIIAIFKKETNLFLSVKPQKEGKTVLDCEELLSLAITWNPEQTDERGTQV